MKAPLFWEKKHSLYRLLFLPFSFLYQFISSQRERLLPPTKIKIPVICVGNITLGGTGKTPVTMMIAAALKEQGLNVHILSRGYGGKLKGPLLVNTAYHTSQEVGDEPLLLAQAALTWVSKNKVEGAKAAVQAGAKILLLDDGLQNPSLHKDFNIIVVNGEYGLGNECVFPAGPLRETVDNATKKANAFIIMGKDTHSLEKQWSENYPVFQGHLNPNMDDIQALKDNPIYAFAGIGHPKKFFGMQRNYGLQVIAEKAFPDHYSFKLNDLKKLQNHAHQLKAHLVTTEKDYLRLPHKMRQKIQMIRVHAVIPEKQFLLNLINKIINHEK